MSEQKSLTFLGYLTNGGVNWAKVINPCLAALIKGGEWWARLSLGTSAMIGFMVATWYLLHKTQSDIITNVMTNVIRGRHKPFRNLVRK